MLPHTLILTLALLMQPGQVVGSNPYEKVYPMLKWDRPWLVTPHGLYSVAPPYPFPEQSFQQWHNSLRTPGRHSGALPVR